MMETYIYLHELREADTQDERVKSILNRYESLFPKVCHPHLFLEKVKFKRNFNILTNTSNLALSSFIKHYIEIFPLSLEVVPSRLKSTHYLELV